MFAKRKGGKNRKRRRKEDSEEEDDVVLPMMKVASKPVNSFSTKKQVSIALNTNIESDRTLVPKTYAGNATYESNVDTEHDRDARAIMEKNLALNKTNEVEDSKVYRGQAGYKNYVKKDDAQVGANKYTGTQGPIRASTWSRSICRFDYQPDICKDYKETGFCGYGDSCKFMHDRGDYKSGWQIEKEYAEEERLKKEKMMNRNNTKNGNTASGDDHEFYIPSDDEEEQFACTICRGPFRDAVETICGHIFCQQCALKQYKKTGKCFNCPKSTNGVFNVAHKFRPIASKQTIPQPSKQNWSIVQ